MSLPSKHAPGGISRAKEGQVLVSGRRRRSSTNYTIRLIENRVGHAAQNTAHVNGPDRDIEMVPMDSFDEVEIIADYVAHSRSAGDFSYDDDAMELDQRYLQTKTITLLGNLSYLVIDTNFILSHLKVLDELKDIAPKYGLRLVIPMAVMHELDGLKGSRRIEQRHRDRDQLLSGESVAHLARWANDWVYSCLANGGSTVVGQKMEERIDKLVVKDDAILDCCLYLQKHNEHTLQVLLSNDKNLCVKALSNNVLTVSYRSNMSAQLIAQMIHEENIHRFGNIVKDTIVTRDVEVEIKPHPLQAQDVYRTVFSEVQKIVLSVVHRCMSANYGDEIDLVRNYDRNSVLTLDDASRVMIRFWIPVFSHYLKNSTPFGPQRDPIMTAMPHTKDSLDGFIQFWARILSTLYREEMNEAQNSALRTLINRWEELAESC